MNEFYSLSENELAELHCVLFPTSNCHVEVELTAVGKCTLNFTQLLHCDSVTILKKIELSYNSEFGYIFQKKQIDSEKYFKSNSAFNENLEVHIAEAIPSN